MGSPATASLFSQRLVVGVADMGVSNSPGMTVSTYALGSCVGVVAFDPLTKAGGILHLMLPHSSISPDKSRQQPAMFADTGLPLFFRALAGVRVDLQRAHLFLAGGACVLQGSDTFRIGERNVTAVFEALRAQGLSASGQDTGGIVNRTLHLEIGTGLLTVRSPNSTDEHALA